MRDTPPLQAVYLCLNEIERTGMIMEFIEKTTPVETVNETRKRTAEEIYAAIGQGLSRLLEVDGLHEGHSSVIELREHQAIALRALNAFDSEDSLIRAA